MTLLCIAGLVWLGCAAVIVLGLCAAAHRGTPSLEEVESANHEFSGSLNDHGTDFLRKAA
jgi:hypothetical protein